MLAIGATVDHVPTPRHFEVLTLAEVCLRPPLPRPATLKRQRHGRTPDGALSLRLAPSLLRPQSSGGLALDAGLRETLAWAQRACGALDATALVVPTPPQLTPGARGRELLSALASELREGLGAAETAPWLVWEPHGPWELERAAELADALSLVCAFDPLQDARPAGARAYGRVQALGEHSSLSDATLEDAIDAMASDAGDGMLIIDGPRAFRQATRARELLAGLDLG